MARRTLLTDSQVRKALEVYVDQRLNFQAFADLLGLSQGAARQILTGFTWKHIVRPDGFEFPWPEHDCRKDRGKAREKLDEAYRLAQENNWTVVDFEKFLGVKGSTAILILKGHIYKDMPRPDLNLPRARERRSEQVREAFDLYVQNGWTAKQFAEHLSITPSAARDILKGVRFKDIPRPIAIQNRWKKS
jgi:hypothetical protein